MIWDQASLSEVLGVKNGDRALQKWLIGFTWDVKKPSLTPTIPKRHVQTHSRKPTTHCAEGDRRADKCVTWNLCGYGGVTALMSRCVQTKSRTIDSSSLLSFMGVTQLHTSAYLSYFSVTHHKRFLDHSTITFLSACKTGAMPLHKKKSKR